MTLREIIKDIKNASIQGDDGIEITGVDIDSRQVAPGHLFVAIKGTQVDGHQFITKAIDAGATAVMCEQLPEQTITGVTYVVVESTEASVGKVATPHTT